MLYLPFSKVLLLRPFNYFLLVSSPFASTVGPQLLVFSANEPCFFYSQQLNITNRQQTQLRTTYQTKETF
jgi:choline-glycine betaine transporter